MKQKNNRFKIAIILLLVLLTTGCTTTLTDAKKKPVQNPETGQNLTKNILCRPTSEATIEKYKENKVDIDKLPACEEFKITSGGYEGIWTSFLVKPMAFIILWLGKYVGNYGLSLILVALAIRLILLPFTKKTAMTSELMKEAQPELAKIEKKYANKTDQESMMRKSQEMTMLYKKYNISPFSGCLFSFIQLPLLFIFLEAVNRLPAIFEENFLGLQLGTTPMVGFGTKVWWAYGILALLIAFTTYFSFKFTMSDTTSANGTPGMKYMPIIMSVLIIMTGLAMPSALGMYWIVINIFTVIQNIFVKRGRKKRHG